jgi:hypothetical protein
MAKRVKGGYKNRITEERSKNAKLSNNLQLFENWNNEINTDTSYILTLAIVCVSVCITLALLGSPLFYVLQTSGGIFIGFILSRLTQTAKTKAKIDQIKKGDN